MKKIFATALMIISVHAHSIGRLTDDRGRVIGYEKTLSNGQKQMLDSRGRVTGYYNPKTNTTITGRGRVVGSGNQLSATLKSK